MSPTRKRTISIFIIWLFTIAGIIGILSVYKDWFLSFTWLNLLVYLWLIIWNNSLNRRLILALLIPFGIGMLTEYLGVNYGLIFGNYEYGDNLGFKMYGVPLMIAVNWAILTYCTAAMARAIHNSIIISSLLGAIGMVFLDVIMEVSAPRFDFWEFDEGVVPLQNYVGWFFTAFLVHLLLQKVIKVFRFRISLHIFIAILVFFTTFLIV